MLFVYSVILAVALGLLQKGSIKSLNNIKLKNSFLVLLSIGLQLIIFNQYWQKYVGEENLTTLLYAVALLFIYIFLLYNLKVPGMKLIALGTLANAIAIFSNGGHMPASLNAFSHAFPAERVNELIRQETYYNSVIVNEQTKFPFLCDIFWVPDWLPLANVFSVGDVLICAGAFILIWKTMTGKSLRHPG